MTDEVDVIAEMQQLTNLYIEVFGEEPVLTGMGFSDGESLANKMIKAIETGIPLIEEPVPVGAVV